MFRKKKGPGGVQGYARISRMIEDRQREIADDADTGGLEDDTIVMRSAAAETAEPADEESVSLLDVRGRGAELPVEQARSYESVAGDPADGEREAGPEDAAYGGTLYETPARSYTEEYAPSQRKAVAAAPEPPAMRVPDIATMGGSSLVAVDATWEGKLRSQGDIRVEGTLRGEIETEATLIVAPHARIHGTVRARNVMLGGDIEGDIACEERLEILPGGSARGQINSGTLVVHEGAYIDSRFQMRRDTAASEA